MTELDDIIEDLDAPCDERDIIEHERYGLIILLVGLNKLNSKLFYFMQAVQ